MSDNLRAADPNHQRLLKACALVFVFLAAGLPGQGMEAVKDAERVYAEESFEKAFAIIVAAVPEDTKDRELRIAAAEVLSGISLKEYFAKNLKNAYDGFRKSLKYDSTNSIATQYFLKIRRENDVSSLANEGESRSKPVPSGGQATPQAGPRGSAPPAASGSAPAREDPWTAQSQLLAMEAELRSATQRLSSMESSVNGGTSGNDAMMQQLSQQQALIQNLIELQSRPQANSTAPSAQELAIMAQTMRILTDLADRDQGERNIIVQSDPAVKELVVGLNNRQDSLESNSRMTSVILIIVVAGGIVFLSMGFLAVFLVLRSRRRQGRSQTAFMPGNMVFPEIQGYSPSDAAAGRLDAPLASGGAFGLLPAPLNADTAEAMKVAMIKRDLLFADRLKRMHEEALSGTLSWDNVRKLLGDLETGLRSDILGAVERRLDEGDFISPESILPIVFPFMADYDDFLREKAERLARRALIEDKTGDQDGEASEADGPFGLKALLGISKSLDEIFKMNNKTLITARLSRSVGKALGMPMEECGLLYKAALAHDCGYLMLDKEKLQSILAKPEISEEDFNFIMSHTVLGLSYFGESEIHPDIKEGILHHHERNDGSGYPDGLKKDAIHRFAKIIGTVETYAALVSKRVYRKKHSNDEALAILIDGTRDKYDSDIVKAIAGAVSGPGKH
jgi:HD-GYP domain-containing protein (c-di-GMP phosphodiesterase class II)